MKTNKQNISIIAGGGSIARYAILACLAWLATGFHATAQNCQNVAGNYSASGQVSYSVTVTGYPTETGSGPASAQETITQTGCNFALSESAEGFGTANLSGYVQGNALVVTGVSFSGLPYGFHITSESASGTGYISGNTITFNNISVQLNGSYSGHPFSAQETIKMTLTRTSPSTPWPDASDLGNGKMQSGWFGIFNETYYPWIYHQQHGWMYVYGTETSSIWLYNQTGNMGFLWTSSTVYPWMWSNTKQTWLYYVKGSQSPRWFFNWNSQKWEQH